MYMYIIGQVLDVPPTHNWMGVGTFRSVDVSSIGAFSADIQFVT